MTPEKERLLLSFLGQVPEALAARLAKAVEVDRLAGGNKLPHDLILDGLRPALRRIPNVERTPTPFRLFCGPFEDLLISGERKEKQKARIERRSAKLVWTWLKETLCPAETEAFETNVRNAVLAYKHDDAKQAAAEFWAVAAAALHDALAGDAARKQARAVFGGEVGVADAVEIGLMLSIGGKMMELHAKMPRPQPALTDDLTWMLRGIYDAVLAEVPDAAPYVAVAGMNRLAKPWEALRLPILVTRNASDTLISSTDMGLVGELLFSDMEMHANAIHALKPQGPFDADVLARHVAGFAELSSGLVKEMELRRDGKWGQRLLKERSTVGNAMDKFMERGPRDIAAALPTIKTGSYSGGPRAPDLARMPDAEKSARAVSYARLIVGCRKFAAAACFGAKQKDAADEAELILKSYNEDIVKELRASEGGRRDIAEAYFNLCVELTTILFSSEEGEFLRRRGRAALGVVQPAEAAA